jgi:hypothetical protein
VQKNLPQWCAEQTIGQGAASVLFWRNIAAGDEWTLLRRMRYGEGDEAPSFFLMQYSGRRPILYIRRKPVYLLFSNVAGPGIYALFDAWIYRG